MATGRAPIRKVKAGGLGGAATIVAVWLADLIPGLDMPAVVAAAISTLVGSLAAYQTRSAPGEPTTPPPPPLDIIA